MADFPKKQQQCLIPKYLLDYLGEVNELHPDPSDLGGGDNIEAGTGIVITGDETKTISVDDETVAMVANLSTVAFSGSYSNLSDKPDLSVYELKEDAFTGDYDDLTNKPDLSVYELKSEAFSGNYNDLTNKPDLSVYAETADLGDCAYLDENELSIAYSQITGTPSIPTNTSDLNNDSGFITSSALSGYATETWVGNQGYLTSVSWSDVSNKPTFATVATTGDYDDLTNKPDLSIYELAADAFSGNYNDLTNKPTIPTVPTNISAFTNDSGYITGITSSDVTTALGYTPGTSNFSGSYTDLTDKPTIPTATSQLTNDSGFITSASLRGYVQYETVSGSKLIEAGNSYGTGGNITGLTNYNMVTQTRNTFELPNDKSGTIALISDIPSVSGYALLNNTAVLGQQWTGTNDFGGLITVSTNSGNLKTIMNGFAMPDAVTLDRPQITVRDYSVSPEVDYQITVPTKNGTMALTSDITNVSGTNDGTNWTTLTIGSNTYGLASGGSTYTAGTGIDITNDVISIDNTVALKTDIPTVPTNVSAFTNDAGYITGITSSDVTTALGYTPGTSNFSGAYADLTGKPTLATVATTGDYDDLTNKPTIPTVNTDSVFMVKTFNFNANTRNIFTINISNTNFVGTGTFVQTEYDSTENVYLGYLSLGLRINTSANIADDTTILTFATAKFHP